MAVFQSAADAITAFDRFCDYALGMLDDPAAVPRIVQLKWANRSYDQRRFPIADPDHYHQTLRAQLANVLGPQRYNLLAEGYYRTHGDGPTTESTSAGSALHDPLDLAGIRYDYRRAAERQESGVDQSSS